MSDLLVAFLRARLDERERAVHVLVEARATDELPEITRAPRIYIETAPDGLEMAAARELLADVEAKRRLIDAYVEAEAYWRGQGMGAEMRDIGYAEGLEEAVRLLVLPFQEHPECHPSWLPHLEETP